MVTPATESHSEILIIGAGLIGSSVAMHLARAGLKSIRVIDFDLEGTFSSSELNAGGVRATWSQPVNIELAKVSLEYFAEVATEVGYRPCGYLWLRSAELMEYAMRARERQQAAGWEVQTWDPAMIQARVPFLDKLEGVAGGFFSPRDGLINPNLLKQHYRTESKKRGVRFEDRIWVQAAELEASGVRIRGKSFSGALSVERKLGVLTGNPDEAWEPIEFTADRVINCAGAWAPLLAKMIGYPCSSQPIRRQVSIFDCRDVDLSPYGMIVDTSGVYFHPEASNGLAGFATSGENPGFNFNYDGETFFNEIIWPALYERSTKFERLKHLTGWSGLYEVSQDECAVIGEVTEGSPAGSGRVFEAHSFSGRGAMQSYGAGLALAEKITQGRYETVDVSQLGGARFGEGKWVRETLII